MTTRLFSELGISPESLKAINRMGFEQASPIQAEAIPVLMQGRDVVGQSQTGSGKTLAFAVPAIEKVDPLQRCVQALILCPTRELAVQVSEEVHKLSFFKRGIHVLPIYGGQSYERQYDGLRQGAQIVIGTPGRVMDHMRRGSLRLNAVKMVILDEADVMLDMGFRDDIEFILKAVPPERQTVFFCATLPRAIQDLIQTYAREPQNVRIEQKTLTVPTVEQVYYEVDRRFKIELLTRLIDIHDLKLGIIFCNTKRMVDDLVDHLNAQGYSADRLHGDMGQAMRDRVMNKFRKSGLEFLVATDVAARGIDVDDVQVVFNYDLPYDAEDYVHRIGRTGRAGRSGRAISFVAGREVFQIQHIERFTKMKIKRCRPPTADEVEDARANVFLDKIRATLEEGKYQRQDTMIERLLEEGFTTIDIASALLHHLHGGEEVPSTRAPHEEPRPRPDRPPYGDAGRYPEREPASRPIRRSEDRPVRPSAAGTRAYTPAPRPPLHQAPAPQIVPATSPIPVTAAATAVPSSAPAPAAPALVSPPKLTSSGAPAPVTPSASATPPKSPKPSKPPTPLAATTERVPSASSSVSAPAAPSMPAAAPKPLKSSKPPAPPAAPTQEAPTQEAPTAAPAAPAPVVAQTAAPMVRRPAPAPRERTDRPPYLSDVRKHPGVAPAAPVRQSRRTPDTQTRLYMNVGEEMGVGPGDVVGAILGETGLPAIVVGTIDIRERHLFVDVAAEHTNGIIAKLNRTRIKGHKLKVKVA